MKVPIACSLTNDAAADRIEEWRTELSVAVTGVTWKGDSTVELTLGRDIKRLGAVVDLACREKACCGFFDFAIRIEARAPVLVISVPGDAAAILADFAALAEPAVP